MISPTTIANRIDRAMSRDTRAAAVANTCLRRLGRRSGIILHGPGRGLRLHPNGYPGYWLGIHEPEILNEFLSFVRTNSSVYDIGAFIGIFGLNAARIVGPSGYVAVFEPDSSAAAAITKSKKANEFDQMDVVNAAVSDEPGYLTLGRPVGGHLSVAAPLSSSEPGVRVAAVTIDEHVTAGHLPPDVVKIDVEGAEMAVLRGMHTVLTQHSPVIFLETHGTEDEVRTYLTTLGYNIRTLNDGYHVVATKHP